MNECGSERAYDNIAVGAFENKFKKKPLPSLSSRKGLTNWRFLLKNNKALCAPYFNLQPKVIDRADVVGEAGASE